jgi:hypothetical protein
MTAEDPARHRTLRQAMLHRMRLVDLLMRSGVTRSA